MVSIKSNNAKKDGIIFRTIRVNNKNKIQEEVSLPAFSEEKLNTLLGKNLNFTTI